MMKTHCVLLPSLRVIILVAIGTMMKFISGVFVGVKLSVFALRLRAKKCYPMQLCLDVVPLQVRVRVRVMPLILGSNPQVSKTDRT